MALRREPEEITCYIKRSILDKYRVYIIPIWDEIAFEIRTELERPVFKILNFLRGSEKSKYVIGYYYRK